VSLATDNAFRDDGAAHQMATVSGSNADGYVGLLEVGVALRRRRYSRMVSKPPNITLYDRLNKSHLGHSPSLELVPPTSALAAQSENTTHWSHIEIKPMIWITPKNGQPIVMITLTYIRKNKIKKDIPNLLLARPDPYIGREAILHRIDPP
jgi:hypothetical protein